MQWIMKCAVVSVLYRDLIYTEMDGKPRLEHLISWNLSGSF